MTIHWFDTCAEAYRGCQESDGQIRSGDVICVEGEKVVGIVGSWHIAAVTINRGAFQPYKPGTKILSLPKHEQEGIPRAQNVAAMRGWKVQGWPRGMAE